jgi:uncharacterized protein (TIGR02271 family)
MPDASSMTDREGTIPLAAETARIGKRVVETGRTVIHKTVSERDEVVEALLERNDVSVERVTIGRVVAEPPASRQEGDTWVIPVLEERLVVEKQLVLKEELRIRTAVSQEAFQQTVRLREEHVEVETQPPPESERAESGHAESGHAE